MADEVNSGEKCEKTEETTEYNPHLDFFSDQFDPLLALNSRVSAPIDNAKKYDNLALYTSAVDREKNPENYRKKNVDICKEEGEPIQRRWQEHQLPIKTDRSKKKVKNIFTKMEKAKGPLGILKKCVDERLRVKVYTRNDKEVRGYCLAYIIAFDKHFNMALEDVTEVWTRSKKPKKLALDTMPIEKKTKFQKRFALPEIQVSPHETNKKLEKCSRYVDQLLMRGEHVVLINILNDENTVKKDEETPKQESDTIKEDNKSIEVESRQKLRQMLEAMKKIHEEYEDNDAAGSSR